MRCAESVELLSELHANQLDEIVRVAVTEHLVECAPCAIVFQDLIVIITSASFLRSDEAVQYPDQRVIWQRISLK